MDQEGWKGVYLVIIIIGVVDGILRYFGIINDDTKKPPRF